jgi:threonine/homoserine/homoserine lactone efflux protein
MTAIPAFTFAAALMTMTPGLDTALVLRTAAVEGGRQAIRAGAGISFGTVVWGLTTGLGLGALLAVSETAYAVLQIAGAAYLLWLGVGMIRAALKGGDGFAPDLTAPAERRARWFLRGLTTNLLNPKVGVFYVSFLPQFIPAGGNVVAYSVGLAAIHGALGILWFGLLIAATRPLKRLLARPAVSRALDGLTGAVLIGLGLKLALERR